jgi:hypothetical protein
MVLAGFLGMVMCGCQLATRVAPTDPLSETPINSDEAMQHRNWAQSSAEYKNDTVVAFPTLSPLVPAGDSRWTMVTDTGDFMGNAFYATVGFFTEPDWQMVEYKQETEMASYTLMPPLPANAGSSGSGYATAPVAPTEPAPMAPAPTAVPPVVPATEPSAG